MIATTNKRTVMSSFQVCIAALLLAAPGRAQATVPSPAQAGHVSLAVHELEACRATLLDIASTLHDVSAIRGYGPGRRSAVLAWEQFEAFTHEQLELCTPVLGQIHELSSVLTSMRNGLLAPPQHASAFADECPEDPVLPASHCEDLPAAEYLQADQDVVDFLGSNWEDKTDTNDEAIAVLAIEIADGIYTAIDDLGEQTVAGVNFAAAATPFAIVLSIAKGLLESYQVLDGDIDSAEISGSYERVGHLHTDLGQMAADIEELEAAGQGANEQLDALSADLDALLEDLRKVNCEIIRLLHTPEKKRASVCDVCADQPGFPYEFKQKN